MSCTLWFRPRTTDEMRMTIMMPITMPKHGQPGAQLVGHDGVFRHPDHFAVCAALRSSRVQTSTLRSDPVSPPCSRDIRRRKFPPKQPAPSPANTVQMRIAEGMPIASVTAFAMPMPPLTPTAPPTRARAVDSMRNCRRISARRAPIALRMPISRVRLRHRHQHDVHDHNAADHQRNGRDDDHHEEERGTNTRP